MSAHASLPPLCLRIFLSPPLLKLYKYECSTGIESLLLHSSYRMDALLNDFKTLNEKVCKPFAKFKDYPSGSKFNILSFTKYATKFGPSVVVECAEQKFNLPRRFEKLFDTDEKIEQWNAQQNLIITYSGTKNGVTLVAIDKE
jgi:hypothetical protein